MRNTAIWFKGVNLHEFDNKVEMLFYLGHAIGSSFPDTSEECKKAFVDECKDDGSLPFQQATISLQKFSNLKTDADFGPITRRSVKDRFCPLPDIVPEAANGSSYWGFHDLTVWHDMDSLSPHDEKEVYMDACNMWAKYTPLTFTWWTSDAVAKANLFAHARRIDGAGGVLAWHYLPPRNAGRNVQLEGRFDTGDNWTALWKLLSTIIHEVGHGLGLRHSKNPRDIMFATINGTKEPAAGDIAAIRAIYGRGNGEPFPPSPPPVADELVSSKVLGKIKDGRYLVVEHSLRKSV